MQIDLSIQPFTFYIFSNHDAATFPNNIEYIQKKPTFIVFFLLSRDFSDNLTKSY